MLKKIFMVLALIVIVLILVVAFQPADFRVERSITIAAPANVVFAQVNDFHNWQEWSPWAKLDPACKVNYEGPASGKDASFSWSGNDKVCEGRMTILESNPFELIKIKLEFIKPFEATNTSEFTFKPDGKQTVVTWSMYGTNNFIGKAFCLFMDMDKTVGGDFEKGLAQMKALVEAAPKKKAQ
jgi:hypothetical protein